MKALHHIPKYPLSNFIQHMVYVSGSLPVPYIKELPEGGINLIIELNENTINTILPGKPTESKTDMKHAWISGMQKQAILYKNNPDSSIISIRFTPGGFYSLTKIPITALDHAGIEAEAILGNSFKLLYHQLLNTSPVANKFALIETWLSEYSFSETLEHDVVRFINKNLDKNIDWLVLKSGYSQKHVIHILKKHTGFSPKYLQRINRFHKVVNEIQRHKKQVDWFSVVQRYGYHDQAHLIKDFGHFSEITPTEYLASQLLLEQNSLVPDMILQLPEAKRKGR